MYFIQLYLTSWPGTILFTDADDSILFLLFTSVPGQTSVQLVFSVSFTSLVTSIPRQHFLGATSAEVIYTNSPETSLGFVYNSVKTNPFNIRPMTSFPGSCPHTAPSVAIIKPLTPGQGYTAHLTPSYPGNLWFWL